MADFKGKIPVIILGPSKPPTRAVRTPQLALGMLTIRQVDVRSIVAPVDMHASSLQRRRVGRRAACVTPGHVRASTIGQQCGRRRAGTGHAENVDAFAATDGPRRSSRRQPLPDLRGRARHCSSRSLRSVKAAAAEATLFRCRSPNH